MKTIILGPPGTGKTTTLLNLVEEFLRSGTDIKNIGYFSFTKKAAWEATRRAEEKFMIDQKEIPYFRTLHYYESCRLSGFWFESWYTNQDGMVSRRGWYF